MVFTTDFCIPVPVLIRNFRWISFDSMDTHPSTVSGWGSSCEGLSSAVDSACSR
jgi:hypothetical protein